MKLTRFAAAFSTAVLAVTGTLAAYPTPEKAGFHHCALIYDKRTRTVDDLYPYAAYIVDGQAKRWMFDAYLFLIQNAAGVRTEYGESKKGDWEYHFNQWFGAGRDLEALDAALDKAAAALGPPPSKRMILFSVPYPNPKVTDFGDVDGDGISEDLSTEAGMDKVLSWFTAEARKRFQAAKYKHLALWGFYWMREDLETRDDSVVRMLSDKVHAAGERLMWIPYFNSPGRFRWKDCGIDLAVYQPNYAFSTRVHGGRVGRNRLPATAQLAAKWDMGVEIEAFDVVRTAPDRRVFLHYLSEGAPARSGYQSGVSAYYLSTDIVEKMAASPVPEVRRMYDALAAYVANKPVPDPDPKLRWTWTRNAGNLTGTTTLPAKAYVGTVEVSLRQSTARHWKGIAEAQTSPDAKSGYREAGWSVWSTGDDWAGENQLMTIPVARTAKRLKLTFRGVPGVSLPDVKAVTYDYWGTRPPKSNMASGCPYTVAPEPPAKYGDTGNVLTDGSVPNSSFSGGGVVGWQGTSVVAAAFDLGKTLPISRVEAHCEGGGAGAVFWPGSATVFLSAGAPPPYTMQGFGALPKGMALLTGSELKVDTVRSDTDKDGNITFTPRKPVACRYVNVLLEPNGWLMLKEIRIFSEDRNVAPEATYTLRPRPGDNEEGRYQDDGLRLTDGVIAQSLDSRQVYGWQDGKEHQVMLDLGGVKPVSTVTVWALKGGESGILAPKQIAADISDDGETWVPTGTKAWWSEPEDGRTLAPVAFRITAPAGSRARYVRVRALDNGGWAMLSEIEVD